MLSLTALRPGEISPPKPVPPNQQFQVLMQASFRGRRPALSFCPVFHGINHDPMFTDVFFYALSTVAIAGMLGVVTVTLLRNGPYAPTDHQGHCAPATIRSSQRPPILRIWQHCPTAPSCYGRRWAIPVDHSAFACLCACPEILFVDAISSIADLTTPRYAGFE
jgi:hypothetical protein